MKTTIAGETLYLTYSYKGERYLHLPTWDNERHDTYTIRVRYNGEQTTFNWHDSLYNTKERFPKVLSEKDLQEALYCALSDADSYEYSNGFENFCYTFGYSTNEYTNEGAQSRQIYNACKHQYERFCKVFGKETMNKLYWELHNIF